MKGQVAASAVAFASLAREGFTPSGDLLLLVVADEEVGAGFGLSWLVEAHPDAARCDYAVNEGGGDRLVLGGRPVYLCATAEKMSAPFRLRVHGRSGHASMPGIADNALVKAARYVTALAAFDPPKELIPEARGFLEAVLGEAPPAEDAIARANEVHPLLGALVEPLLALTLSPTMIEASRQAKRDPRALRGRRGLPSPARADPRRRRAAHPRGDRRGRLRDRVARGGRRHAVAYRDAALGRARLVRPGARARRGARPHRLPGIHGQPLSPGGIRDGRVRLLPA